MKFNIRVISVPFKVPFSMSRGTSTTGLIVTIECRDDEIVARGEASADPYFGETTRDLRSDIEAAVALVPDDPLALSQLRRSLDQRFPHGGAAACAIDVLAHDRAAQHLGVPIAEWLGFRTDQTPATSYTVGLAAPEAMADEAVRAASAGFQRLKLKLGADNDVDRVRVVRKHYGGALCLDPNGSWNYELAARNIDALQELNIEFIEQPVDPADSVALRALCGSSPIPIVVDESVSTVEELGRVAYAHGVNVKLQKCGGIARSLEVIAAARAHGMRVLLGCRPAESSITITAAAHIASLADWVDLDGNLLLSRDPYVGVEVRDGRFRYPARSGLGVVPRAGGYG